MEKDGSVCFAVFAKGMGKGGDGGNGVGALGRVRVDNTILSCITHQFHLRSVVRKGHCFD